MHRPLIIVCALVGLGILSFFMTGGLQPVETSGVRQSEVIGQPRQSTVPTEDAVAEAEPEAADPVEDVAVVDAVPTDTTPIEEDVVVTLTTPERPTFTATTPEIVTNPEGVDVADTLVAPTTPNATDSEVAVADVSLADQIDQANAPVEEVAEVADPEPELSDAPIIASFEAPAPAVDVASLSAPSVSGVELSAIVETSPTRSRAPASLEGLSSEATLAAVDIATQSAPLPAVSEKPSEEVAVFASRSSGSLLLTATALGTDGVLRPSAVGSLQGISAAILQQQSENNTSNSDGDGVDVAALAPAPRPQVDDTAGSSVAQSVVSFLNNGALPSADTLLTNHIVRPGDTLAKMAIQYYGDRDAFIHIYNANRDVLARPEQIRIGQSLRIPVVPGYN